MACPFPCALLAGCIEDHIHERLACFLILFSKNICCNFNQIAVEFALIPVCKDGVQLFCRQAEYIFKKEIRFGDQLHVSIFDPIMDHFDIMSCPIRTKVIGFLLPARHDRRPFQCALFSP
ncbi:Uncharacterised protein [Mycobacteroides abscessus subsp. abscessus]|nr:Uncharacterised protein [Mycobacteroides abscessus subsp. abscessus]